MAERDDLIGKREGRRIAVRLPARLIMPDRGQQVWITDLSEGGVAIEYLKPLRSSGGLLVWLDYRRIVDVVWHKPSRCGLRFSHPLEPACIAKSVAEASPVHTHFGKPTMPIDGSMAG